MEIDDPDHEPPSALSGATILVVDDDATNREIARIFLQDFGLKVETAADGWEALEALEKVSVSLILMDIQMPNLNGLEAAREIRKLRHFSHIPIIAYTADDSEEMRLACQGAGMDDFLAKPAEIASFNFTIRAWIKN